MIGIYKITNTVNDKCYIGKSNDITKRFKEHINKLEGNKHPNKHLQSAWNNYGRGVFSFSIVEEVEFEELLNDLEIYYIEALDTLKNGYNMTNGGDGVGSGEGSPCYNATLHTFYHYTGIVEENITFFNFFKKYNLERNSVYKLLRNDNNVYNGWASSLEAFNTPKYIKRTWYNIDGRIEVDLCAREMYEKYGYNTFIQVVEGKAQSCGGWSLQGSSLHYIDIEILTEQDEVNSDSITEITLYDRCGNSYKNITKDKLKDMLMYISEETPNKTSINTMISGIFSGRINSCKGLYLSNPLTTDVKTFINDDGEIVENINKDQFKKLTNCSEITAALVWNGTYKSSFGWRVLNKMKKINPPKLEYEDFGEKYNQIKKLNKVCNSL